MQSSIFLSTSYGLGIGKGARIRPVHKIQEKISSKSKRLSLRKDFVKCEFIAEFGVVQIISSRYADSASSAVGKKNVMNGFP